MRRGFGRGMWGGGLRRGGRIEALKSYSHVFDKTVMDNVIEQAGDTLLILGNGFDIDLGFPTRYKDFFLSDSFPFVNNDMSCHSLGHYVYEIRYP